MFFLIGNQLTQASCFKTEAPNKLMEITKKTAMLLDFGGAITLIVLGALAFNGLGGHAVASLNAFPGGAVVMIGGGLVTLYVLRLLKGFEAQWNSKST